MIKRLIKFLSTSIWEVKEEQYKSLSARWAVRQFKIFTITSKGFGTHSLNVRSAALTFYSLMAIVPIAAVVFGIIKGFGLDEEFVATLHRNMPQHEMLIDYVLEFAHNLVERTKGGWLMGIGSLIFIWAIIRVFSSIESVFNHIWEVHKSRSIARKLSDYLTIVVIVPILWLGSNSMAIYLKSTIAYYTGNTFIEILYTLASFVAAWVMFSFMYKMMPNTKVKFSSAFNAGMVAGTMFQIFQFAYWFIQKEVSAYNAIYGSFAALPLFLIWLQASWQILFFGAELSYAYQNIHSYERELEVQEISDHTRKVIILAVMCEIIKHFKQNKGAISGEKVASNLNISSRLVYEIIFELEEAVLICAIKDDTEDRSSRYIPARELGKISIAEVLKSVGETGKDISHLGSSMKIQELSKRIKALEGETNESPHNKLLTDLI